MEINDEIEVASGDNIYESGNILGTNVPCKKNEKYKNHEKFISVKNFNLSYLPPSLQHEDVLQYVIKQADLTVHIFTKFVSGSRPNGFPGSQFRGTEHCLTGTGFCCEVERYCDKKARSDQFCQCQDCKQSGQAKRLGWEVRVKTAAHVVFDDEEAAKTEVFFYFDDTESQTIKIYGTRVEYVDGERDRCELVCVVHDSEKMDKVMYDLKVLLQDVERVGRKLHMKYSGKKEWHTLCVIISHPHGCRKQISVGELLDYEEVENGKRVMRYNTPTCQGSSGAAVIWASWCFGWFGPPHVNARGASASWND